MNKSLNDDAKYSLSNLDIQHYLGENTPILNYEDLTNYDTIKQLLPKQKDFVIFLFHTEENYGHWITLIRHNKSILYFDSYGYRPDKIMDWNSNYMNKQLHQSFPQLSFLLNDAVDEGFKVTFSETQFQKRNDYDYSTCGRWVTAINLYYLKNKNPTLKGFYDLITSLCKSYELVPDLVVTKILPI